MVCSVSIPSQISNTSAATVKRDGINDVTARVADRCGSRHTQTLERCASRFSTDVRHNDQFENRDIGDFNPIFLDLPYRVGWVEIPLLAHNFSKGAPASGDHSNTLVFALYLGSGKLGLAVPFTSSNVSPIWPAAGIAVAAVLIWGIQVAPAIAFAAF
jgi:hypothetical protein